MPQYKSGPFLSGFDGYLAPLQSHIMLFLFFSSPTWPSMNSSRQMAQIGLELELLFDPGAPRMLGSRATLRAVCARFQPADGTHGLLVHRVLGVEKLLL